VVLLWVIPLSVLGLVLLAKALVFGTPLMIALILAHPLAFDKTGLYRLQHPGNRRR
jgi:hypothetical protein